MHPTAPTPVSPVAPTPRRVVVEVLALWLVVNLSIRAVRIAYDSLGGFTLIAGLVPLLFIYAPVADCRRRGVDANAYAITLPPFTDRARWLQALALTAVVIGLVIVPYTGLYHLWHTAIVPTVVSYVGLKTGILAAGKFPPDFLLLIAYHLFYAAIPEEIFYRGYLQSRLDEVFAPQWRVLGTVVGPSLLWTSLLFALGHSLVLFQWWHLAIVLPSLVFGYLKYRTGEIIASAFFHAWCNVYVNTLDHLYGVAGP